MTTRRTLISRSRKSRVTPEALEAFKRARKIRDNPQRDELGFLSEEDRVACSELHELLGRGACDRDVMDTYGTEVMPTEIPFDCWWNAEDWEEAVAIRRELERLLVTLSGRR
jgi:hypothetical protein